MKQTLILFTALFISSLPCAAGWISSGGESLIYARNPWFLKNTLKVNYCLQMDEASFSVTRTEAEKLIGEAFQYWKTEFSGNHKPGPQSPGTTVVADQVFQLVPECKTDTPLIFKFGLKTLNPREIEELQDPKKFIGVTVRKEYSLETLTGTGIIYITADKGADAYTNNGHMVSEAWKSPTLLRYALIHELGHFFGSPHVGSGIMSEVFMTVLLNKRMSADFETTPQLSFLNPPANFEVCRRSNSFSLEFFGVPNTTECLKFQKLGNNPFHWTIFKRDEGGKGYDPIGEAMATVSDQTLYNIKPAVIVQLPPEQKVFSAVETVMGSFLVGATFSDSSFTGVYRPKGSSESIPLQMTLSAERVTFVGSVGTGNMKQQKTVLNFSQLSFMKAIFP